MTRPRATRSKQSPPVTRTQSNRLKRLWCAVYTRKSSEEGLDQAFNSLDAQREAGEAYVQSQAQEGWRLCPTRYDDGGYSGGTLERPAVMGVTQGMPGRAAWMLASISWKPATTEPEVQL